MSTRTSDTATPKYYMGLDLGQKQDYTALVTMQRVEEWTGGVPRRVGPQPEGVKRELKEYQVQDARRFDIGTPYREVAQRVADMQRQLTTRGARCPVIADTTGVGLPVFEMLQEEGIRSLRGITITGGDSVSREGRIWRVPKRELASAVQVLLQNGLLAIRKALQFAPVLRSELQNFKVEITRSGHDTYEAWREGDHDDLVLALAMACWFAEHGKRGVYSGSTISGL